jgi:uncharacterized protein (DUF433 family)
VSGALQATEANLKPHWSTLKGTIALDRISVDPNRMCGLPSIRDTRVTVSALLGQLAAGAGVDEVLADFPE